MLPTGALLYVTRAPIPRLPADGSKILNVSGLRSLVFISLDLFSPRAGSR